MNKKRKYYVMNYYKKKNKILLTVLLLSKKSDKTVIAFPSIRDFRVCQGKKTFYYFISNMEFKNLKNVVLYAHI